MMSARHPVRRLLTVVLLSQVMVIQALLLNWVGGLAVAGEVTGGLGVICSSLSENRDGGGTEPPGTPDAHRDCLGACLTGHPAAKPPDHALLSVQFGDYALISIPAAASLLERYGIQAFLARAPPTLT